MSALAAVCCREQGFSFDESRFMPDNPASDLEPFPRFGILAESHSQLCGHSFGSSYGNGLGHGLIKQCRNNPAVNDPPWAFPFGTGNPTCRGTPIGIYAEFELEAALVVQTTRETSGLELDTINHWCGASGRNHPAALSTCAWLATRPGERVILLFESAAGDWKRASFTNLDIDWDM